MTEAQMVALFGEGRHPDADAIETAARAAGASERAIDRASRLGRPYPVHDTPNLFRRRLAGAYRDHNHALGLAEDTPIADDVRARIRTDLATTLFAKQMGRPPADARELSGFLARSSRQATTAVAGYDLTFSPVKSVSTLWAIAPFEVAREIERAHQDAVADTLAWLEDHAAYTRRGRRGVAQVEVRGLIAAAFTHRDSRAGDPDLHTHVAVSNKVQALDGTWLSLDGRMVYRNNVAASERYNTRLEANLRARLGLRFAPRPPTGDGREAGLRPVREVVGVDGALPLAWSARRGAIEARRADLSAKFQAEHGRPPTAKEAIALAQQANLATRHAKHEPRSHSDQREIWRAEAAVVLGGQDAVDAYVAAALPTPTAVDAGLSMVGEEALSLWAEGQAAAVLATVQSSRATWREHHLRAEAERRARTADLAAAELDIAVELLLRATKTAPTAVRLGVQEDVAVGLVEPALLRRSDGTSVFEVAGSTLYTTTAIMEAEERILWAAARADGVKAGRMAVEVAIVESAANGLALNPSQADLVRELATSGRRVQLALAPAGTGKTAALRVLAHAWAAGTPAHTDRVTVVGLAPSAAAAAVLREHLGAPADAHTDTLAKLIHTLDHPEAPAPEWMRRIGPGTLVVVDEAGMAGTIDLARVVDHALAHGASVRLVGDDQQLAAVGAGGVLRDIATTCGAVTLSQVMRFTHPESHPRAGTPNHAEAAASLALREGKTAALGFYLDHHRVHVGDLATVTDQAYTAWKTDRAHGVDAVMLAPTRDLVAHLNARARTDRLATAPASQPGCEVGLADGSRASAGDEVITRRNNRRIPLGPTDWVKNGDRWTVRRAHPGGALDVAHRRTARQVTLPAAYVAEHVELGYATTVHGAQGVTADTAYTVASGAESRQLLYVALTRGRHANHVYLTTAGDGDPHSAITRDALLPPTAVDILAAVIGRDDAPTSATSAAASLADPAQLLSQAADEYHYALTVAAEDLIGAEGLARIDATLRLLAPAAIDTPAHPALRSHLALLAADGHNVENAIAATLERVGLAGSHDAAAVLDWRLTPDPNNGSRPADGDGSPLPWLPPVPARLAAHPQWGPYLCRRDAVTREHARSVRDATAQWIPTTAPPWAAHLIDRDPDLVGDLALWRAANDIPETDAKPTGPAVLPAADSAAQRALDQRVNKLLTASGQNTREWAPLAESIDPRIPLDAHWPALANQLAAARRAGIDIATLARAESSARPLPDELPAAALWWRLSEHLTPGALTHPATNSGGNALRPKWTADLAAELGEDLAARVTQDPVWPSLVAAVTLATADGWTPSQVIAAAHDLLRAGQDPDAQLRPDELAQALVWRVALLNNAPTYPSPGIRGTGDATESGIDGKNPGSPEPADRGQDPDLPAAARPTNTLAADPTNGTGKPLEIWVGSGEPNEQASEAQVAAILEEWNRWDHAPVSRQRILELNQQAADYYQACYPNSWAPAYLRERLGPAAAAQLDARADIRAGYAPPSWTALTNHLRDSGATDEEIIAAGLGTRSSTGHVIDRFRDRLIFPISDSDETHGFIGRRNPTKDTDEHAGPKYLNTPETDLFRKREALYGLDHAADNAEALVLVEGPLDALAVTLGANGAAVGVAPLGTSFTDIQADKLTRQPADHALEVVVGFDNDTAGHAATARAYWKLAVRDIAPRHLQLPAGFDPAQLLQHQGNHDLVNAITTAPTLATTLIRQQLEAASPRSGSPDTANHETLSHAIVIAASTPIAQHAQHLGQIAQSSGADLDTLARQLIDARTRWRDHPDRVAANALAFDAHPLGSHHASGGSSRARSRQEQARSANPLRTPSQSPSSGGAESRTSHNSPEG